MVVSCLIIFDIFGYMYRGIVILKHVVCRTITGHKLFKISIYLFLFIVVSTVVIINSLLSMGLVFMTSNNSKIG